LNPGGRLRLKHVHGKERPATCRYRRHRKMFNNSLRSCAAPSCVNIGRSLRARIASRNSSTTLRKLWLPIHFVSLYIWLYDLCVLLFNFVHCVVGLCIVIVMCGLLYCVLFVCKCLLYCTAATGWQQIYHII